MSSQWSSYKLRVRYSETDQMRVVYHANYLPWLELGRTEFLRDCGISYKELEAAGMLVPVLGVNIEYMSPAFYDDAIQIHTRLTKFGALKLSFAYEVYRSGDDGQSTLLAKATTDHAWLNKAWRPVRLKVEAPQIYELLQRQWVDRKE